MATCARSPEDWQRTNSSSCERHVTISVLHRPAFDHAAIVAWHERQLALKPRRCELCRRLARPGTARCVRHALGAT